MRWSHGVAIISLRAQRRRAKRPAAGFQSPVPQNLPHGASCTGICPLFMSSKTINYALHRGAYGTGMEQSRLSVGVPRKASLNTVHSPCQAQPLTVGTVCWVLCHSPTENLMAGLNYASKSERPYKHSIVFNKMPTGQRDLPSGAGACHKA